MGISNGLNKKSISIIVLILAVIGGYFLIKKYSVQAPVPISTPNPSPSVSLDPKEAEYQKYLAEAMNFRTLGFQGDKSAFLKAIESYKKAAEVSADKVWIPYLNLGNTYRLVQDYKNAEDAYDKALEISPGESIVYLAKIDMYKFELKKTNKEINALYDEALKVAVDNTNLVISYAAFLRDSGKYSEALKYYKILSEKFSDNQAYKDEIADLEKKIK